MARPSLAQRPGGGADATVGITMTVPATAAYSADAPDHDVVQNRSTNFASDRHPTEC